MPLSIRAARLDDCREIRWIHASLNRPKRRVRTSEYLVAETSKQILGCAAVRVFAGGGYLYGLAVRRESQRTGVGTALTQARVERIRQCGGQFAVVMAMFWNVGFFRKLGFSSVRRGELPSVVRRLADFRNPIYKRSAVLWRRVQT